MTMKQTPQRQFTVEHSDCMEAPFTTLIESWSTANHLPFLIHNDPYITNTLFARQFHIVDSSL